MDFSPAPRIAAGDYKNLHRDVFGLAASFYRLITNQYPREAQRGLDPHSVILHGKIVSLRDRIAAYHPGFASFLDHALRDDCTERFANGHEM